MTDLPIQNALCSTFSVTHASLETITCLFFVYKDYSLVFYLLSFDVVIKISFLIVRKFWIIWNGNNSNFYQHGNAPESQIICNIDEKENALWIMNHRNLSLNSTAWFSYVQIKIQCCVDFCSGCASLRYVLICWLLIDADIHCNKIILCFEKMEKWRRCFHCRS